MKKIFLCLIFIILVINLIGCREEKSKINIDVIRRRVSVYELLPQSLYENSQKQVATSSISMDSYRSETFTKLIQIYEYIDELFIAFNNVVNEAIDNHEIAPSEVYSYGKYKYFASYRDHKISVSIEDTNTDRVLQVWFEDLPNGDKSYSGKHTVQYDEFSFDFIEQKELKITFHENNQKKHSYATITKSEGQVKSHIIYDEGVTSYDLYSIATEELTSILYHHHKVKGEYLNHQFEVINPHGDVLYQSYHLVDGEKATGWLLNALDVREVEKISSQQYLVDDEIFTNILDDVNIYEMRVDENLFYLIGQLIYQITPIIQPRQPFDTTYYQMVSNIAQDTLDYYHEINQ